MNRVLYPYSGKKFLTPACECSEKIDDETAFRNWRLQNRLFLNPLNDLGSYLEAASDVLMMLHLEKNQGKPSVMDDYFTLLKQEFTCAVQLFFEAMLSIRGHDAAFCDEILPIERCVF